jgi:hypothetical protein
MLRDFEHAPAFSSALTLPDFLRRANQNGLITARAKFQLKCGAEISATAVLSEVFFSICYEIIFSIFRVDVSPVKESRGDSIEYPFPVFVENPGQFL